MEYVGGLIQKTKWFNWDDAIRLGLLDKNSRGCSTHSREIRSVKALAIRHAKKHCELPHWNCAYTLFKFCWHRS